MGKETKTPKFTKAPWNVTKKSWDKPYKVYGGAAGKTLVATIPDHETCQCIEDEGNVRLVAAEPEELYEALLEACARLCMLEERRHCDSCKIKNALAKARGEVKE